MKAPTNLFTGIRQLEKLVTLRSDELQAGRTNEQYLVIFYVTKDQLAKIDRKRAHHLHTNELIIKLMPSAKHQSAHLFLAQRLL